MSDEVSSATRPAVLPVRDPIVRGLLQVLLRRAGGEVLLTFTEEEQVTAGTAGQVVHVRDYDSGRWRFELGDPGAAPACAGAGCRRSDGLAPHVVRTPGLVGLLLRAAGRDEPALRVLCPACARRHRPAWPVRWWRRVRRLGADLAAAAVRFWTDDV